MPPVQPLKLDKELFFESESGDRLITVCEVLDEVINRTHEGTIEASETEKALHVVREMCQKMEKKLRHYKSILNG